MPKTIRDKKGTQLLIRVDNDVAAWLREGGKRHQASMSLIIQEALRYFMEREEKGDTP
jgi:uncharacterized protein (DUF4415 family)